MLTMHPTLLIGPYDWDPQLLPEAEFYERLQSLRAQLSNNDIACAIVYGDSCNHAELLYLSNFLPKLGPALLLIPRDGAPTLLVSGAPNMLAAARCMTWVEKTMPLRDPEEIVRRWLEGIGDSTASSAQPRAVVIGGEAMSGALYKALGEVVGAQAFAPDATLLLHEIMQRSRPVELQLIRQGCAILTAATQALEHAVANRANASAALLTAESAARRAGAQDVRALLSLDGGRTLRPFEQLVERIVEPLQAYLAVRFAGYWVDGFVHLSAAPQPVAGRARDALATVIANARAGVKWRELHQLASAGIQPFGAHAMVERAIGSRAGLSLVEVPADDNAALQAGSIYSLRVGASGESTQHAIVSALVRIHDQGNDLLWPAI